MRTNVVDSCAWRCLTEYMRLLNIVKMYDEDTDRSLELNNYISKLEECEKLTDMRKIHNDEIKKLNEEISVFILKNNKLINELKERNNNNNNFKNYVLN